MSSSSSRPTSVEILAASFRLSAFGAGACVVMTWPYHAHRRRVRCLGISFGSFAPVDADRPCGTLSGMAALKPNEVRIEHPAADKPLVVLRRAFENGRYPGWSEVGAAPTAPANPDPDEDEGDPTETAETATDNEQES